MVCQLLAIREVATVAVGEVACKDITAGRTRNRCEDLGTRSNVVLFLEAAIEDVDLEEGVVSTVATRELDALGLWKRGTAIAINHEVRAHGVELMAHQNKILEWKLQSMAYLRVVAVGVMQSQDLVSHDLWSKSFY